MDNHPVILFDGICNFCNSTVNFVIKRDKKAVLRFATLQSHIADVLLINEDSGRKDLSSFIFIENNTAYTRSTAALRVCRYMNGLWPLIYGFIIIPRFIRDGIYNWVAGNRYKWFGKKEICMVPTQDVQSRFLNEELNEQ